MEVSILDFRIQIQGGLACSSVLQRRSIKLKRNCFDETMLLKEMKSTSRQRGTKEELEGKINVEGNTTEGMAPLFSFRESRLRQCAQGELPIALHVFPVLTKI